MPGQSITFDFLTRGADTTAGGFRKVADNTVLAARGAKVLSDAIEKLGAKEDRTAAESVILAKALRQTGDAEDRVAARAVLADAAIRRLDDSMQKSTRSSGGLGKALSGLKLNPGLLGPALALAPAIATLGGVAAGAAAGLSGAFIAGGAALASFGAVAKPVLSDALKASQAVNAAQNTYNATIKQGVPVAQAQARLQAANASAQLTYNAALAAGGNPARAQAALQTANANAQLTYNAAIAGGAKPATALAALHLALARNQLTYNAALAAGKNPAAALAAYHLALAKNQLAYNAATNTGTFKAKAYAAEQAAIGKAYANLSPQQISLSQQLGAMANAWDAVKAAETPVVAGALQPWLKTITDLTGHLSPVIAAVAPVIKEIGTQFDILVSSGAFSTFVKFVAGTGSAAVGAAGNLLTGFLDAVITLLPKFNPLIQQAIVWLGGLGGSLARWANSQKTADQITAFMAWFKTNGPVVGGLLTNLGLALKALAPGLTSGGLLELKVMSDFLGFVAKLPPGIAKPLFAVAGALLILQKTGVVTAGIKLVGLGTAAAGVTGPAAAAGAAIAAGIILKIREDLQGGFKGIIKDIPHWFNFGGLGFIAQSAQGWADLIVSKIRHSLLSWEDDVRHKIANTWDGIRHDAAPIWDKIYSNTIGSAIRIGHNVETQFTSLRHSAANIFDGIRHDIAHVWDLVFSGTAGAVTRLGRNVEATFGNVKNWLHQNFITPVANLFTVTLPNAFRTAVTVIGTAFSRVESAVRAPIAWVVTNVIDRLISAFDWVSSRVGGPNIPQFKFATGGQVPGAGRGDSVLAMLTPGEVVVPTGMVAAGAVDHLRGQLPGFAAGGKVGQNPPVNLHTGAGAAGGPALGPLGSVLGKIGDLGKILLAVTTGNSTAATNAFKDLLGVHTGGAAPALAGMLTAMPGKLLAAAVKKLLSFGGASGNAIVADAMRWIGKIPYVWGGTAIPGGADCSGFVQGIYQRHGIMAPRTSEEQGAWVKRGGAVPGGLAFYNSPAGGPPPGHVAIIRDGSMVISQGGGMGPQLMPLTGALPLMFTGTPPGGFGKAAGGTGPASANAQQAMAYALSRMGAHGWNTTSNWDALVTLWMGESGWDRLARNPSSGAYGIPQALPASKMGAAANPPTSSAGAQIDWGMGYIGQVYGNPSNAFARWLSRSPHWYDQGGYLPTGLSLAYNGTGRPEMVVPHGGSGGGGRVVLEVRGGGHSTFDQFLLKWIRENVRVQGGGSVQMAFGR